MKKILKTKVIRHFWSYVCPKIKKLFLLGLELGSYKKPCKLEVLATLTFLLPYVML